MPKFWDRKAAPHSPPPSPKWSQYILLNYQVPIMKRLWLPKSIFMPVPNTRVPKLEWQMPREKSICNNLHSKQHMKKVPKFWRAKRQFSTTQISKLLNHGKATNRSHKWQWEEEDHTPQVSLLLVLTVSGFLVSQWFFFQQILSISHTKIGKILEKWNL